MTRDRRHALDALSAAARQWVAVSLVDADPLAIALAHSVTALHAAARAGDVKSLTRKGGPQRWARAELGDRWLVRAGDDRRRAAADFVELVGAKMPREDPAYGWRELRTAAGAAALAEHAAAWLARFGELRGFAPRPAGVPRERVPLMAEHVQGVARRERVTARALAIGLLRGWGMTAQQATDALKR
jgi:hypothetical protein